MKFAFINAGKGSFPNSRMCRVFGVSQSGFFACQERTACRRLQQDMLYMAHLRTAFALSNDTYGSPGMHRTSSTKALRSGGIARHAPLGRLFRNRLPATDERARELLRQLESRNVL